MQEQTLSLTEAYAGRLLRLEIHDIVLDDGLHSRREIVRHPGAAAVVAELPDGRFMCVRQYRKALEREMLEFPAGCLEPGESPDKCARREIREETGLKIKRLRRLGKVFTSPGFCNETVWLYHALLSGAGGVARQDADERVAPAPMTRRELESAMKRGRIRDCKTLAAWWLFTCTDSK